MPSPDLTVRTCVRHLERVAAVAVQGAARREVRQIRWWQARCDGGRLDKVVELAAVSTMVMRGAAVGGFAIRRRRRPRWARRPVMYSLGLSRVYVFYFFYLINGPPSKIPH